MNSKPKLIFFGNERLSSGFDASNAPVLRSLIKAGYPIAAIVSHYEKARSRKARELEIKDIADEYAIPLLLPERPKDIIEQLRSYDARAGILVAYGRIIPQTVIDIFPAGIINLHPSLLPNYRGPTPIESAILNGDTTIGISLMKLAKELDAGPVYAQRELALDEQVPKHVLTQQSLTLGADMLIEHLPAILAGKVEPKPQDNAAATYCALIAKQDGILDWTKSAVQLEREVRAYLGWPGSRTQLFSQDLTILEAQVVEKLLPAGQAAIESDRLIIGTQEKSLEITTLRPAGRSSMSTADFLRGRHT